MANVNIEQIGHWICPKCEAEHLGDPQPKEGTVVTCKQCGARHRTKEVYSRVYGTKDSYDLASV